MLRGFVTHTEVQTYFRRYECLNLPIAGIIQQTRIKHRVGFVRIDQRDVVEIDNIGLQQEIRPEQRDRCRERSWCRKLEIATLGTAGCVGIGIADCRCNIRRDLDRQVEATGPQIFVQIGIADFGTSLLAIVQTVDKLLTEWIRSQIAPEIFEAELIGRFTL